MPIVADILARKGANVATIAPDATVLDAANLMNRCRIGALCVVKDGTVVGVFSERDLLNRVVSAQVDPAVTKVSDVMTTPVITCGSQGRVDNCMAVMSDKRIRHLPVVDDGRLVGLISTGDLLALQASECQALVDNMYEYLHGRT